MRKSGDKAMVSLLAPRVVEPGYPFAQAQGAMAVRRLATQRIVHIGRNIYRMRLTNGAYAITRLV